MDLSAILTDNVCRAPLTARHCLWRLARLRPEDIDSRPDFRRCPPLQVIVRPIMVVPASNVVQSCHEFHVVHDRFCRQRSLHRPNKPLDSPILLRHLPDSDRSTAAHDRRPPALFSARNNPHCNPVTTPPVVPGLRPRSRTPLARLVTKVMSNRCLGHPGTLRCGIHALSRVISARTHMGFGWAKTLYGVPVQDEVPTGAFLSDAEHVA